MHGAQALLVALQAYIWGDVVVEVALGEAEVVLTELAGDLQFASLIHLVEGRCAPVRNLLYLVAVVIAEVDDVSCVAGGGGVLYDPLLDRTSEALVKLASLD